MLEALVSNLRPVEHVCIFTRFVCAVFSAAFVNDQSSLEELEKAWGLLPLAHQHLNSPSDTHTDHIATTEAT